MNFNAEIISGFWPQEEVVQVDDPPAWKFPLKASADNADDEEPGQCKTLPEAGPAMSGQLACEPPTGRWRLALRFGPIN